MNSGLDNPEIVSVEDEEYGAAHLSAFYLKDEKAGGNSPAALKAGIIVAANANQNPPRRMRQ